MSKAGVRKRTWAGSITAVAVVALGMWLTNRSSSPLTPAPLPASTASSQLLLTPPDPPPPAPASVAATPVAAAASAPRPAFQLDEGSLMALLREIGESDATRAIELAREGNLRFPESPDAPERTAILIHALAHENRPSEARGEAEDMVNRYPDSEWVREVERFTGAHRHRNIRLRDDGRLEYN